MHSIFRSLIRTLSFPRQEIIEILRQPRLVFTLILGPFLILLLVGVGYRNQQPPLRTLLVIDDNSPLKPSIEQVLTQQTPFFTFEGTVNDQNRALDRLRRDEVDLVVVAPKNAEQTIRSNQQAVFTLYHHEIDPTQIGYINYLGQIYTDQANRLILQSLTAQGQNNTSDVQTTLAAVRTAAEALRTDLQHGDTAAAQQHRSDLNRSVTNLEAALGATAALVGTTPAGDANGNGADVLASLKDIRQNTDAVTSTDPTPADEQRVSAIEDKLSILENALKEFRSLDPLVLVSPFRSDTKTIAALEPRITDFFAPSVIVLLIQHLAVTFGALSLVRDRRLGLMELYRVSPVSSLEILIGKYISYLLFGGILAAILTVATILGLGVPMLGSWPNYALTLGVLLFTSLGIGFVISLLSPTDSQAVQFSMIVLLASVFLSGFLMNLSLLWAGVRVVSWTLPATYGIAQLQNIALRGEPVSWLLIGGLAAWGALFFMIAYVLLKRTMSAR